MNPKKDSKESSISNNLKKRESLNNLGSKSEQKSVRQVNQNNVVEKIIDEANEEVVEESKEPQFVP